MISLKHVLGISIALSFTGCSTSKKDLATDDIVTKAIQPAVITEKTLNDTDDPAIWINPTDASKSLVLGTDKGDTTGGIYVFDLEGKIDHQRSVMNLKRPNNIDIEYGLDYQGKKLTLLYLQSAVAR